MFPVVLLDLELLVVLLDLELLEHLTLLEHLCWLLVFLVHQ